jgi:hypothetical protein
MDRVWAARQLGIFRTLIDALDGFDDDHRYVGEDEELSPLDVSYQDVTGRLVVIDLVMRDLMEAARPGLGNYTAPPDGGWSFRDSQYWSEIVRPRSRRG